jgi:recombination protein RecT
MDDIKEHAKKYSKSYGSSFSPWTTSFEEMAKKTVLKSCLKYAPLKSDFVKAVVQDESIKNEVSDDMYDVPNVVAYEVEYTEVDTDTGEVVEE